jgi:hypothetical protein
MTGGTFLPAAHNFSTLSGLLSLSSSSAPHLFILALRVCAVYVIDRVLSPTWILTPNEEKKKGSTSPPICRCCWPDCDSIAESVCLTDTDSRSRS